jgi:nucleotide-binding universal stress UspA family protein
VEIHLDDGDPASEILDRADEQECDLIVMGTHGLTGLRRILMGSVAEQVSRKATCPVLTLKVPYPEAALAVQGVAVAAGC